MSRLTRFGRRQAGRVRSLSRPHAAGLAAVLVLCGAVAGAAATEHLGTALVLIGVLTAAVLAGVVHLSRLVGGVQRAGQAQHRELRACVDHLQRRLVAAVERERLTAGDRHLELGDRLTRMRRDIRRDTVAARHAVPAEVEALFQLFAQVTPRAPMPSSGNFALSPVDMLAVLHLIRTRRPRLVLELGSGASTVWMAYALEAVGGRLVSLDHDAEYARRTRAALAEHSLGAIAQVREAPLTPVTVDGRSYSWYDTAELGDLTGVELLLIDGPPAATGPDARYPAMHVVSDLLAPSATVVVDDADRNDEQAAVRRWVEKTPGLTVEEDLSGRHAVLSYRRPADQAALVGS
ncbi:O-methyltransferase [Mangrovihabitans endophyticus]|uniref:Methyltransferase domain-containing protein n=1 Tax=Mangrovihabitans endophyticus TaxID=1751298 RepID=A0A8J3BXV1_9ACTN|nr:class I SAM-dependent methyltransferase [Mangrovihabitans endophyticus]GGK89624.1 hypothetical protein GCM10012284_24470 [Mangrovihabitans endophyticus]